MSNDAKNHERGDIIRALALVPPDSRKPPSLDPPRGDVPNCEAPSPALLCDRQYRIDRESCEAECGRRDVANNVSWGIALTVAANSFKLDIASLLSVFSN